MKEIMTVTCPIEKAEWFDSSINNLIREGWILAKRDLLNVPGLLSESFNAPVVQMLYAELEKWEPIVPEEVTL